MQDIRLRIQEIEQGITGVVNIGAATVCTQILIDYISRFRRQFPNIKINIMIGHSDELLTKLRRKEIDIALLLRSEQIGQYQMKTIDRQPFVVIIPTSWLASFNSHKITLEQIAPYPLILLGPMEGHSFHEILLETFHERRFKPNVMMECKDVTVVIELVSRELGLSIIPKMDYSSPISENVTLLELEEINIDVEPTFVRLKDEPISKAAIQFWEIVQ
jgi:LysR family transcriptional regulator, salicylic acid-responsive activator of bsdBCD